MAGRIGILTGGGDCPGLNAAIRAVVKGAAKKGWEVIGFRYGWKGMIDNEIMPLFSATKRVAGMLEAALSPDGLSIGINQGRASGQEVEHIHIHILPRFLADGGGSFQSIVENPPKESVEEMAERIRKSG